MSASQICRLHQKMLLSAENLDGKEPTAVCTQSFWLFFPSTQKFSETFLQLDTHQSAGVKQHHLFVRGKSSEEEDATDDARRAHAFMGSLAPTTCCSRRLGVFLISADSTEHRQLSGTLKRLGGKYHV